MGFFEFISEFLPRSKKSFSAARKREQRQFLQAGEHLYKGDTGTETKTETVKTPFNLDSALLPKVLTLFSAFESHVSLIYYTFFDMGRFSKIRFYKVRVLNICNFISFEKHRKSLRVM